MRSMVEGAGSGAASCQCPFRAVAHLPPTGEGAYAMYRRFRIKAFPHRGKVSKGRKGVFRISR